MWMVLFTCLIAGCAAASYGRKFDDTSVSQIRKNVTTKAQIRANFGEPLSVTTSTELETWTYQYSNAYGRVYIQMATYGLVREQSDDQMLVVIFKDGKVVDFNYTK